MTRTTMPIIRCDGPKTIPHRGLWPLPCHRLVEADRAERWRRIDGADLCPACWDAMQTIEDWVVNR